MMRDVAQRIAVLAHEGGKPRVGDRLVAVVDGEHGADVRVKHEAGETAQDFRRVVRFAGPAAFSVGDGNDAVDVRMHPRQRLQPRGELPGEARGLRSRADDHDEVSRAHAAFAGAAVAGKRTGFRH